MKHERTKPATCPDTAADSFPVVGLGLQPGELAVLALQRHFFCTFAEPATQGWMQAFALDDGGLAHLPRGAVALLVLTQVQALRAVRRSPFRFSNPFCPVCSRRVTPDEMELLSLLRNCQTARDLATAHAARLSDGVLNPGLELASARLAEALTPVSPTRFH